MKIIICGDSWLTKSDSYPNTHFGEIIARKLNCDVEYYSKLGMSNACICIQIATAIQNKPDIIIFNTTYPDRIEFPIKSKSNKLYYQSNNLINLYNQYNFNDDSDIVTFPLNFDLRFNKISQDFEDKEKKIETLINYSTYLYDTTLKTQIDSYMILGILKKLEMSNTRYIWCYDLLQSKSEDFNWVQSQNDCRYEFKRVIENNQPSMNEDPGYHTTPEIQVKLSDIILNKL